MNKRNICLLLAFAMVLSLFAGLTPAVGAVPFAESIYGQSDALHPQTLRGDSGEDLMIDVYFVDRTDSNPAYAYYFNINGNSVDTSENLIWPGNRMKAAGVDMEGDNYYKVTLSSETYTHIIFNNGSSGAANQTGDLPFPTDSVPDPLNPNGNPFVVYCITRVNGVINCTQVDDVWPSPPQETEATCTESGWRAYVGLRTGAYAGEETLPPLGHDWSSWETVMPPTCTETGEESRVCFRCGAEEFHTLDALGHQPGEPVNEIQIPPDCIEPGSSDIVVRCIVCGQEISRQPAVIPPLGHDYEAVVTEPTCTEGGFTTYTCSRCGDSYVDDETEALGHEWSDWSVPVEPTCTAEGTRTRSCVRCNAVESEPVAALGHQPGEPVEENRVEPTVTEPGGYDTVVYCQRCGQELSREHTVLPVLEPQEPILDPSLRLFYSVSTEIEIVTQYSVIKSDVQSFDSWYVEISKLDADGNPTETKRFGEGQEGAVEEAGASVWSVNYVDVTAKEMGVPYRATLHAFEANGQEHYSESVTKTVREVLLEVVQDDRSTDERRTLAADMLNYGAAAQAYFGFDVEHPVNANLSTAEQEDVDYYASTGEAPANLSNTGSVNVFCSTSIMNRIVLHVSLLGPTGENVKVRMKELNGDAVIDLDAENQGRVYEASYSGLTARNMRTAYEVSALVDGAAWGTPAIWSVEGHIKAARENPNTSQEELALMNALLHYVDAVAAAG